MKRKILVLLFVAILLTFFAIPCFADSGSDLHLDCFDLLEHEGEYITLEREEDENDQYPFYVVSNEKKGNSWALYENGQLTLHNFRSQGELWDVTGGHPHMVLTLNLEGDNHLGMISFDEPDLCCIDKFVITGTGSLTMRTPGNECISSNGPIVIDENFTGTLNLSGATGIRVTPAYEIAINNGNININAISEGISTIDGFLKINGGNVNISGREAGVHVECGSFDIKGGNVSIESPNGMAVYHNDFSGGGKMPSIKGGYLGMELTEGIKKLNIKNAENVHSFKVNYTEPLEPTDPVDDPADPTDPADDPTTDPVEDPTDPVEDSDPSTENVNIYIAGGCGVLLIAIIVILVVKKKRKKQ